MERENKKTNNVKCREGNKKERKFLKKKRSLKKGKTKEL
jgi:hypothetical protein